MNYTDSSEKHLEKARNRDQKIIQKLGWDIQMIVDRTIQSTPKYIVRDILTMGKSLFEYKLQSISQYLEGAYFDDEVYDIRPFELVNLLEPLFHHKEATSSLIVELWKYFHPIPQKQEVKIIQAKTWGHARPAGSTNADWDWGNLDTRDKYGYVCPEHFTTWKLQAAWVTLHYLKL